MNEVFFLFWLEIQISLQFNDFGSFKYFSYKKVENHSAIQFIVTD